MLLYGRNLLPELALPLRAAHGGPADGKARLPRHIRPAHEKRGGDQPEQVHPRPVGQRKELFHQPYGEAVLGTGHAHPAGGYRLCDLIRRKTNGDDGVYFTYQENDPISFNPFFTEDYRYDIEKRDSIKTLILTLWKREDEPPRRSEEVALSNAVSLYIEKIKKNRKIKPNFNSFYDFVRKDYRKVLADKNVREKDFDVDGFLNVLEPYYKNGEYGYLLNSDKELDLLNKRFIVFELDVVKDNPVLFPVVTIIIMETFINKMRRLQGIRKMILIEEA